MSSDEPKITSVEKVKDPKRVAAGKRLAQISKDAKERKLREKIQEEKGFDYFFIVAIGGLVLAGASLYYTYKSYTVRQPEQPAKPVNTLDSLD